MSPLLPHQKIMLDRALYMRTVHWENEQQEQAQADARARTDPGEPERPLRKAPRQPEANTANTTKSDIQKAKEEGYCAIWDGSVDGLTLLEPLRMLPPRE